MESKEGFASRCFRKDMTAEIVSGPGPSMCIGIFKDWGDLSTREMCGIRV